MASEISKKKPALNPYKCIGCGKVIVLDKNIIDGKGRVIALNKEGGQPHVCLPSNDDAQLSLALKERTRDNQDTHEAKGRWWLPR
jgi:hypothetical protein